MDIKGKNSRWAALKAAFPYTVPILAGYGFVGLAYGIYMHVEGFSFVYPMLMALIIYGGSLEFITVTMLLSPFAPLSAFIVALMVQARHLFYGLAMLKRFDGLGLKRYYLIYAMSDETFAVNYATKVPKGIDAGWFMFWVSLLDQFYWVAGATLGGLLGAALPFDTTGLGFVMTAMFVVIFLSQLEQEKKEGNSVLPAVIGFGAAAGCLVLFGADNFMIPTMVVMVVLLLCLRNRLEGRKQVQKHG